MHHLYQTDVHFFSANVQGWEYEVFAGALPLMKARPGVAPVSQNKACAVSCAGFRFADCTLPLHIAFELHRIHLYEMTPLVHRVDYWGELFWARHQLSAAEVALFFSHLAHLGYIAVSQEYNIGMRHDNCCSEFTVVRLERPAHCSL